MRELTFERVSLDHEKYAACPEYLKQTARLGVLRHGQVTFDADDIVEVGQGESNPESYQAHYSGTSFKPPQTFATIRVRGDSERVQVYATREEAVAKWKTAQ